MIFCYKVKCGDQRESEIRIDFEIRVWLMNKQMLSIKQTILLFSHCYLAKIMRERPRPISNSDQELSITNN